MKCQNCGKVISKRSKYCSNKCQKEFQYKKYIENWKNGRKARKKYSLKVE